MPKPIAIVVWLTGSKARNDDAIVNFTKAIDLNPNDADTYYKRGLAYGSKGDYDDAIVDYTKAIQFNANDAQAYNNRGVVYRVKGEVGLAIEDFNKAVTLSPNDAANNTPSAAWSHLGVREEVKSGGTTARDMGKNIMTSFDDPYESVPVAPLQEGISAMPLAS